MINTKEQWWKEQKQGRDRRMQQTKLDKMILKKRWKKQEKFKSKNLCLIKPTYRK